MPDFSQRSTHFSLLHSIAFIFLETLLTAALKHDPVAHAQAQIFVEQKITFKVFTFFPSDTFFIRFDQHGLLFDSNQPQYLTQIECTLHASGLDFLKLFLTGNPIYLEKIRLEGRTELHEDFYSLLLSLSLPSLLRNWKNWFHREHVPNQDTLTPLLQRIDQQREEITQLTIQLKEKEYQLKLQQHQHKTLSYVYWFIISILLLSICWIVDYT